MIMTKISKISDFIVSVSMFMIACIFVSSSYYIYMEPAEGSVRPD